MRFHATLMHTPENCRVHRPEDPAPDWAARAKEMGVELLSAVQCAPAHALYFVVETDEYATLFELFRPLQGYTTADIKPVRDLMGE